MVDNFKRRCHKCGRSPSIDIETKLYRFPNPGPTNAERCELWAKYCYPNGPWSKTDFQRSLYAEHKMLCDKHFAISSFTNYTEKKLNRHAVPDVENKQLPLEDSQMIDDSSTQQVASQCNIRGAVAGPSHIFMDITNVQKDQYGRQKVYPKQYIYRELVSAPSQSLMEIDDVEMQQSAPQMVRKDDSTEQKPRKEPTTGPKELIHMDISLIQEEHSYCALKPRTSQHTFIEDVPGPPHNFVDEKYVQKEHSYCSLEPAAASLQPDGSSHHVQTFSATKAKPLRVQDNPLYKKCRKYLKRICQLKNSIKNLKAKATLDVLTENKDVEKLMDKLTPPTFAIILQGQIRNSKRKIKGRRWTTEEKIIALRLYKRSAACYRLLRRMWCFPAPSTLKNLLGHFNLNVGINNKIFKSLKKIVKNQDPKDSEYILMFDEMSIKKHLNYNNKTDVIEGYQDHGPHGRSPQEATHALVFMISGIRKKVKQPVAFYVSSSFMTADRLSVLIKEVLQKCFEHKINIAATVCDMGGVNRRALTLLGATKEEPYFKFENNEVVTIFDPPHLLKCFRNMLQKYNLKCSSSITSNNVTGHGIAKWKYIEDFYNVDQNSGNFVFAPKLRRDHISPNNKQKMRVNLAAQVLSHSVAAGMFARISQGLLPAEATITADVISNMDKLFDCFNGDTADLARGKPFLTNMTDTSPHKEHFYKMKTFFETSEFIGCSSSPPSMQGWIWTINAVLKLHSNLKKKKSITAICTRRLQQDPLENLFGTIRGNCGANYNPTCGQFIAGLKTAVLSNLAHMGAGNCEKDDYNIMCSFKDIFSKSYSHGDIDLGKIITDKQETVLEEKMSHEDEFEIACNESQVSEMLSSIEHSFEESMSDADGLQACAYVSGFLLKNLNTNCECCKKTLISPNSDSNLYDFVNFKEYNDVKKSLNYASIDLIQCVENCATVCNNFFSLSPHSLNLKINVLSRLSQDIIFTFLSKCEEHKKSNLDFILNSVFLITVKRFCIVKNRQMSDLNKGLKRKIDILQNR